MKKTISVMIMMIFIGIGGTVSYVQVKPCARPTLLPIHVSKWTFEMANI
jgi:hypothetical protein